MTSFFTHLFDKEIYFINFNKGNNSLHMEYLIDINFWQQGLPLIKNRRSLLNEDLRK